MTFTDEQIKSANERLLANPSLVSFLSNELVKLSNKSTVGPGTYQAHVPDEFAPAHVEARLQAAQRTVRAAGSMASKLLILELQFEEFTSLSERKGAWCAKQNELAKENRIKGNLEAHRRNLANQWQTNGDGKVLTQSLVKAQSELRAMQGALAMGIDLDEWRSAVVTIARTLIADVDESLDAIQSKSKESA